MRKVLIFTVLLMSLSIVVAVASAQTVSTGIKGQGNFAETLIVEPTAVGGYTSNTKRFAFGPTVEIHVPNGWAVSFDVIWHRRAYHSESIFVSHSSFTRQTYESSRPRSFEIPRHSRPNDLSNCRRPKFRDRVHPGRGTE